MQKQLFKWVMLLAALWIAACNLQSTPRIIATAPYVQVPFPTAMVTLAPLTTPTINPVTMRLREIYAHGQALGNRPDVFSKIGDSITVSHDFLEPIGYGRYNLSDYDYLQPVIDYYSATNARQGNSFANPSLAAGVGWAARGVFDPRNSDLRHCLSGEMPLVCEYRVVRPSVALIMFGTNDVTYRSPQDFRADIERIVQISEEMGVIPLLSTIPDQPKSQRQVDVFNGIIVEIGLEHTLPVWDYNAVMRLLPNSGLASDGIHPSTPPNASTSAADFSWYNTDYGYVMRNLTALQMLDSIWRQVSG